jgi:hypothetical protein
MASDKAAVGEKLWERFNAPKEKIAWYYRGIAEAMPDLGNYPMYRELNTLINGVFG